MSFAAPSDQRLVNDIEKLIKTKIELEALELDEPRGRGERYNEGDRASRSREDDGRSRPERAERTERSERTERAERPPRPAPKSRDPFFDQPYEASVPAEVKPAWESAPKTSNRISSNIKPKRKVAALFKTATSSESQAG